MDTNDILWLDAEDIRRNHDFILKPSQLTGEVQTRPVESIVSRVQQQVFYGQIEPDVIQIAATYAVTISRAHAFNDGNKRTALMSMLVFLERHGYDLDVDGELLADNMERCAAGALNDGELWQFIFAHLTMLQLS